MPRPRVNSEANRRLMQAPRPGGETVIPSELYRRDALRRDIERLAEPSVPMADADVLSVCVKYFHASLFPGSEDHAVPLAEASDVFERFFALAPGNGDAAPSADDGHFALRRLADLPRLAHFFRSVANRPLLPRQVQNGYFGLDLGGNAGILLLAAFLQAARNGAADPRLIGLTPDPESASRSGLLLSNLGIAQVAAADVQRAETYLPLAGGPVAFVANAHLPEAGIPLAETAFTAIHAALFAALGGYLKTAVFFPECLIVRDQAADVEVALGKNNRFQPPRHYRRLRLAPRAVLLEGRNVRLPQVGKDFRKYIPPHFLGMLSGQR